MSGNQRTGEAVVEVLRRYLTEEQLRNLVVDLLMIDGNKPYRECIRAVSQVVFLHKREQS